MAEGDELLFLAPQAGKYRFEVDGFTSTDVMVFDITDPANVGLITATQIVSGSIGNKLIFGDNTSAVNRYLALTAAQIRPTASVEMDRPSTWRSPENGADYIVITYDGFYSNTLPLANHRRASGLRVAVAQVSDLYDEFNHGIFNPRAIRDFLGYAYQNWTPPAPVYVLLVGDAYLDYRDRMGLGKVNYVPSQIIETIVFGETTSDSWYSAVSGDDILPDMFIGRLTARTTHEVDYMVDSIIQYEQRGHTEAASWHKNVLLVADDGEPAFESISEQLADRLPFYYTLNRVYANNYPPNDPTTDIQTAIEDGSVLVNYSGHGEYYRWGKWNAEKDFILQSSDIDAMDNPGRLPIVAVANCLNGFFVGPQVSMAEAFQHQPGKGAIAVWAPTNLGYPEGHRVLLSEFYTAVFQNDHLTVGAATTVAKINTFAQSFFWGEMIETYVLFGDPATKIGIPTNYPYVELTSPAHEAKDVALDQELRVVFSKPISTSTVILTGKGIDQLSLTPSWSSDDTVATFSHTEFEHGKTYEFSAIGQDRLGNLLGPGQAPSTWSFTVSDDDIQPTASVGEPSFDGGRVSIPVLFGEPMRKDSVVYTLNPASEGDLDWGTGGVAATFRTATNLVPGQTYTFTLSAGMDLAGNTLAIPIQKSFTVSDRSYIYLPKVLK